MLASSEQRFSCHDTMSNTQNPGCLGLLLRLFGGTSASPEEPAADSFPYRVRDDFLSAAEMSFYHVVSATVGERGTVCPKVGLSDIFFVTRPQENRSAANRVAQKHVDFLVCEPRTMKPLLGIELDDSSHARADRQARDEFVGKVFAAAQLPLLRVPAQRGYNVQEIAAQLEPFLSAVSLSAVTKPEAYQGTSAPMCPKCEVEMVRRTATKGERSGQPFYGCPNYPKCRETSYIATTRAD